MYAPSPPVLEIENPSPIIELGMLQLKTNVKESKILNVR